ncbi:MAG: DUF349 domain-containing protein [Pseudomonadota bacterium]|nr:DUF349 domain-containing protein [Pseudomonadota bacterium]
MLRFLFGKSMRSLDDAPKPERQAARTQAKPMPAAPVAPQVPVATLLAELAARPDGDPGVLEAALASGPAEVRQAALARLQDPAVLARVATEARAADARHAAVLRIDDEALLAHVAQQARTRDKRVYKVARDRLDAYARERERHAMQARWLETVENLAAQEHPELSRVMEVERVWAALQPDAEADARFQQARVRLHACFQAQAEERRQARRQLAEGAPAGAPAAEMPAAGSSPGEVQGVAGESATAEPVNAEAAATDVLADAGAALAEPAAGIMSAPAEAAPAAAAVEGESAAVVAADAAADKRVRGAAPKRKPELDPALRDRIAQELEALEHALEDGHLHDAETRLATLSELQSQAGGVAGSLGGRIRRAVEEIARLRAWRRWGGQQARDHLCDAADALPSRELPPEELGRAIKALRAQWQAIAASEGGAPQHLWERFDAACERAWEPVREHFARQAERRAGNLERREALLADLEARVAALDVPPVDWKEQAFALADAGRRWHTLGPVDRKLSRPLEARFVAASGEIERRVRHVRDAEAAEREALIRRAEQLTERSDGRDTVSKLRELQAEWQARSRTVPLERAREQALWERFRAVCDSLFQARDAARAADDAERAAHTAAEAEAFRKRSELWRGLREAALACSAAELAVEAAGAGLGEQGAAIAARLQQAWQSLPDIAGRETAPVQARQQAVLAVCEGRAPAAELLTAFAASAEPLAHGLLELEIGLGLPSPTEFQDLRRRMQLERLADALRSGGRSDHEGLRRPALALCALAAPQAAFAQRLDAVLAALAPKPPERRPSAPRSEHKGHGGERDGRRSAPGERDGRQRGAPAGRGGERPARTARTPGEPRQDAPGPRADA